MKRGILFVAVAALLVCAVGTARAVTTHRMADTDIVYSGGFITTGGVRVFPGKTLADLEGCAFWGTLSGSAFGAVRTGLSNQIKPYPAGATGNAITRYDFDIMSIDGTYTKAVHIQLYNGEGGVYAKAVKSWYRNTAPSTIYTDSSGYYTVNASTGALTWNTVTDMSIATSATGSGYGVRAIGVARGLTSTKQLAFPGLTVAQIAENASDKLSAKIAGGATGSMLGQPLLFTNAVVTAGTAANPTAIRCEAQFFDGANVKCSVVELSDGEGGDGVYAQLIGGYYKASTTELGMRFLDDDGNMVSGVSETGVPTWYNGHGYGMYNLEVTEEAVVSAADTHHFDRYSYLSGTAQIVFPGVTLSELEGRQFYGLMQGASIGGGARLAVNAYSHAVTRYPTDTAQAVQKLFFAMASVDGDYTKYVVVELSQGTGGVQAKAVKAMYKANTKDKNGKVTGHFASSIPFTVNASGAVALASGFTNQSIATGDHATGYGIKQLGVMNIVRSGSSILAFRGLRVKDIFRGEIIGRACGSAISNSDQMQEMKGYNRIITATDSTTGEITAFRIEMQVAAGYAKCVAVRFTNGADGVYATGIVAGYYDIYNNRLGRKFTNDAGSGIVVNSGSIASTAWAGGYGVCNFTAAVPDNGSTEPATAAWNGGDPAQASSWTCKAGDGTVLPDTLPNKYTQVHISSGVTMSADADLTPYASVMTTAANLTINTSGHKLYVKTLDPWLATTVTDTVGGGELHVVVPEGIVTYNSQIALANKLKLVTEGDGLFMAAKEKQTYTGGTQVASGTFMYVGAPAIWPLGGNNTKNASAQIVTVDAGATLDLNGKTGFGYTTVVFNGGTVRGSSTQFNGAKSLTADSYLVTTGDFAMQYNGLPLNGHTLEVSIANATTLKFDSCPPQGPGTIKITSGGWLQTLNAAYDARDVDFIVSSALNISSALSVHDYEAAYDYNANSGTAALNVYGTFTPGASHNYFYGCTMQDGSTIDLSARTTPLPRASAFTSGDNTLKFADGATVNVEIGARSSDVGTRLVSWPSGSAPEFSVAFALVANGAAVEGKALAVKDDGLYIKDTSEPEYAMWVNGGWQFYTSGVQDTEWGGNVTGNMQVRFTTAAEYDAICAVTPAVSPAAFVLATNKFTNAAGATFDFTRTESLLVGDGTVFDANGGLLKLPAALAGGVNVFTVTNSAEQVGSLEVEVPQDATTTSTKMALTGNLKFVKTGPGTIVVKKTYQTYTGGTQVAAGTLKYAAEPAYWPLGGNGTQNVSAQVVTVDDGATLDINGYGGFGYTTVVFNGGTVKGTTGLFNCAKSLTTNSYLNATGDFNMQYGSLVLNGHTLEIALANAKTLKFQEFTPQGPGKINITSGGWLNTATSACVATNVDFIVGCALNIGTDLSVHDYEAVYSYNAANSGTAALNVYGTFKPSEHDYFYGCTMQDGSTIDLSARTNALPRVAAFTTTGDKTLKFANNATVKIKLGGRKVSSKTPIVSWTTAPDNLAGLKFVCGDEGQWYSVKKKTDGLYIYSGMVIIVR